MVGHIGVKTPKVNGAHNIRVRPFRDGDAQEVRDLFMLATGYARESFVCIPSTKSKLMRVHWDLFPAGSPRHTALRAQLTHPSSIVMYAIFIGGLALSLSPSTRAIGSLLCLSLFGTFAGLRCLLSRFFVSYCEDSLRADLVDIGKHYCVSKSEGTRDAAPSSASYFWVVEAYSDVTGYCEIVGTVGLGTSIQLFFCLLLINTADSSTNDDQTTAELRRMTVSPHHRRLGIGQLLLITLITHAWERGLASVFLTTTSYQIPAIRLYERMGWVVQRRTAVWRLLPTFELGLFDMKLDLTRG